jgi:hypothetical protein
MAVNPTRVDSILQSIIKRYRSLENPDFSFVREAVAAKP